MNIQDNFLLLIILAVTIFLIVIIGKLHWFSSKKTNILNSVPLKIPDFTSLHKSIRSDFINKSIKF